MIPAIRPQAELEEFLRDIAQQTLEANEQTAIVEQRKVRILEEEAKCTAIAAQCEADLAEAMPALERAIGINPIHTTTTKKKTTKKQQKTTTITTAITSTTKICSLTCTIQLNNIHKLIVI